MKQASSSLLPIHNLMNERFLRNEQKFDSTRAWLRLFAAKE
jgi:hypothetical protein